MTVTRTMTPFELEVLIHFCITRIPHRGENETISAFNNAVDRFLKVGFLATRTDPEADESEYVATDKAHFYLAHLCSIPLPVHSWKIPNEKPLSHNE